MQSSQYFFDPAVWKYTEILIQAYDGLLADFEQLSVTDWSPIDTGYTNSDIKSDKWHSFTFITKSNYWQHNINRCSTVKELLSIVPIYDNCVFSILDPGCKIPPHHGFSDQHLRVHMGLKTDGSAWIRVGDQTQHWKEKQVLVFDDWEEHEILNPSVNLRVIFLFDIRRKDYFDNIIG